MARPPFTFDRNTLGSNGSFPLRSMAGPPFEGSQLKNISHFTAIALRRDNPLCRRAAHLSRGVLGLAVDMRLLRAVDGSFGSLSDQIGGCIVARLLVRSSYMS